MKVVNLILVLLLGSMLSASAQTNFFQIAGRDYWVNKLIPGITKDGGGASYVLLHQAWLEGGPAVDEHFVFGKISAIRGGLNAWNRKINIDVNSSSSYTSNTATLINYNEYTQLVLVTYQGVKYLAVEIANGSSIYGFSFTGYVANAKLELLNAADVSDRVVYNTLETTGKGVIDVVSLPGNLTLGDVGVPAARLDIAGGPIWSKNGWRKTFKLHDSNAIEWASNTSSFGAGAADNRMYFFNTDVAGTGYVNYYMIVDGATGNIGMGANPQADYKLAVKGSILAGKVRVQQPTWSDFVFDENYDLPSLQDVEKFIRQHHHLPEIPSAKEVADNGVDVGEINKKLLQKIEELTLYMIEMKKENDALKARVEKLEQQ